MSLRVRVVTERSALVLALQMLVDDWDIEVRSTVTEEPAFDGDVLVVETSRTEDGLRAVAPVVGTGPAIVVVGDEPDDGTDGVVVVTRPFTVSELRDHVEALARPPAPEAEPTSPPARRRLLPGRRRRQPPPQPSDAEASPDDEVVAPLPTESQPPTHGSASEESDDEIAMREMALFTALGDDAPSPTTDRVLEDPIDAGEDELPDEWPLVDDRDGPALEELATDDAGTSEESAEAVGLGLEPDLEPDVEPDLESGAELDANAFASEPIRPESSTTPDQAEAREPSPEVVVTPAYETETDVGPPDWEPDELVLIEDDVALVITDTSADPLTTDAARDDRPEPPPAVDTPVPVRSEERPPPPIPPPPRPSPLPEPQQEPEPEPEPASDPPTPEVSTPADVPARRTTPPPPPPRPVISPPSPDVPAPGFDAWGLLAELVNAFAPTTAAIWVRTRNGWRAATSLGCKPAESRRAVDFTQPLFDGISSNLHATLLQPTDLVRGYLAGIAGSWTDALMLAPVAQGRHCAAIVTVGGDRFADRDLRRLVELNRTSVDGAAEPRRVLVRR